MKFKVPDMSCNHCIKAITDAVTALDPDAKVQAELEAGTVTVESQRSVNEIGIALKDAGYAATVQET